MKEHAAAAVKPVHNEKAAWSLTMRLS